MSDFSYEEAVEHVATHQDPLVAYRLEQYKKGLEQYKGYDIGAAVYVLHYQEDPAAPELNGVDLVYEKGRFYSDVGVADSWMVGVDDSLLPEDIRKEVEELRFQPLPEGVEVRHVRGVKIEVVLDMLQKGMSYDEARFNPTERYRHPDVFSSEGEEVPSPMVR